MTNNKDRRSVLIALAVLFPLMPAVRAAAASLPGQDAMPPGVQTLYNSGSYSSAAEALRAAVEPNPRNASLYYWLGRCYFEMRDFNRSISSWERSVALDSASSEYHDWLGRGYGRKAEQDSHSKMASALALARKTHHEFEVAVQLDPRNTEAQRDLIAFMVSAPSNLGGGEENAMKQIHALSEIDPLEGMLALADLYAERKKFEQASGEYQKILKSVPSRIEAYFEAADYFRGRGDSEQLAQAVEAASKVSATDGRLSYYRGVMLALENKDSETSEKDLRTYINTVPENSELPSHSSAHEYLGELYENRGRPDLAIEQYKTAVALDPQSKTSREALKRLQKK